MRQFKYRQTFATNKIKLIFPEEKSKSMALASLESLKALLPASLDISSNPDLLFNSFNAAVVNMVNLNDDGIQTETALKLYKRFLNKFCDLEHERSQIVGFIVNSGLSQFITDKIITETEAQTLKTPFNISLGSVVWPVANPGFAEMLIESSDETSKHYQEISASWEIGFDDMHLAVGSRDLSEAEIITDPKHIEELKQYLKIYKGEGLTKENEPIYRIIIGDAIPLGIAYTTSPAASVKGVIVTRPDAVEVEKDKDETEVITFSGDVPANVIVTSDTGTITVTPTPDDKKDKNEKNISQEEKETVKNISIMKLTTIEDITDDSLKELSSAAVRNFLGKQISEKIDEISTQYDENLKAKETEVKETKVAQAEIQKQYEETQQKLAELTAQLEAEKEARAKEKVQSDFNARMADLDNQYDLTDTEREVIAKNIRGLDDDQYVAKAQEFEVLLAAKKKKAKEMPWDKEEADEAKKASAEKAQASVEDVLDEAKEKEDNNTPPNTPSIEKTIRDEFADAFKLEDFKISVKR